MNHRKTLQYGAKLNHEASFMLRASAFVLALSLSTSAPAQDLNAHGNFRHMMHMGDTAGMVANDTLEVPQGWGVGALAGVKGEVVILEGQVLVSRGDDPQARLISPQAGDEVAIPAGTTLLLPVAQTGEADAPVAPSPYAGMEAREIKSLSEQDIADLRRGAGWGLALAAELNGVPGPAHLLELKEQIDLTPEQVVAVEAIFAAMQAEAQAAGERLIAAEAAIEAAFRDGGLTPDALRALIDTAAEARAELRFIHLSRHLETPPLLTSEQIARYNELRGYGAADPCAAVPEGHDPAMWRRHNNCE